MSCYWEEIILTFAKIQIDNLINRTKDNDLKSVHHQIDNNTGCSKLK